MMMEAKHDNDKYRILSPEDIISTSFFSRGFDNVATQLSFITNEITLDTKVQKKLRKEIDAVLEESKGHPI